MRGRPGVLGRSDGCSLSGTLEVVGERWTFLILREAMSGVTRFNDFRDHLGIASNLLTARLAKLVEYGIMERHTYQDEGTRARSSYHLTPVGRELNLVVAAIQQWGNLHLECRLGPIVAFEDTHGSPVTVQFVDTATGRPVAPEDIAVRPIGLAGGDSQSDGA
ncbi:HxlR family transcriptional regulator [Actinoplanes sp. N902-109]|nr:HxlR family transcriptional regulator [Actinoplanes sp. N902-109]